ncbi:hypothetical protein LXL04_003862 [Taraxacum kok-saghyz]
MPPKPEHKPDDPPNALDKLRALIHLTIVTTNRLDTISHQLITQTDTMNNLLTFLTTNQNHNHRLPPEHPLPPPSWYKHLSTNNLIGTWPKITRSVETRFGPSIYENHQATIFKLRQTSTVSAYQSKFEKLSNCVDDLPNQALRNYFYLWPFTRPRYNPTIRQLTFPSSSYSKPPTSPLLHNPSTPPALPSPTKTTTNLPVSRLSPKAVQKHRVEGLCFRCPEKFHLRHKSPIMMT